MSLVAGVALLDIMMGGHAWTLWMLRNRNLRCDELLDVARFVREWQAKNSVLAGLRITGAQGSCVSISKRNPKPLLMKTGKEAALQKGSSVQRRAYLLKV